VGHTLALDDPAFRHFLFDAYFARFLVHDQFFQIGLILRLIGVVTEMSMVVSAPTLRA
jgi:hypothetical protein